MRQWEKKRSLLFLKVWDYSAAHQNIIIETQVPKSNPSSSPNTKVNETIAHVKTMLPSRLTPVEPCIVFHPCPLRIMRSIILNTLVV